MVSAVENRARVAGEITAVRPDPDRPGHVLLTMDVRDVTAHPNFPNLLGGLPGSTVDIVSRVAPNAAPPGLGPAQLLVSRGGPSTFVNVASG